MKSNCNLRRAPARTARTDGTFPRNALSLRTRQPSSARHKRDKRWIFSLRPLPHHKLKPLAQRKENQGIPPRTYTKPTKERHSSSARMTAEIKDLSVFSIVHNRSSVQRATQWRPCAMPGLLPYLTLQITDDKTAGYDIAKITDLPGFSTRSTHYHHLAGFLMKEAVTPAHTSNMKLHLPTCSPR